MSGIAGIFNLDGRPVEQALAQRMTAAVGHRGADDEGLWVRGPVGLGHRQLRTTPESLNEHQPISLEDGRYLIVCDGRVDNREELIQALRALAPVAADTSDAELVLRAYVEWDADCLKRIIGDFAFVIWDALRQKLFCARDPMGIRTFYYYRSEERFVFASDIEAILVDSRIPRELNQLTVALYLLGRTDEAEQTFFKGIFQLGPACYMEVSKQGLRKQHYWEPDPWDQIRYSSAEDYVEHFRKVFYEAVLCRLRSISPVGISLSGGMDSTSIACAAALLVSEGRAGEKKLQTFSSVFNNFPEVDERRYIQAVLDAWELDGTFIYADELWGFKPVESPGILWNRPYPVPFKARHEALLARARDSGVRVMLTGEGGDELLNAGFEHLLDMLRGLQLAQLFRELRNLTPQARRQFYSKAFWHFIPGPVKQGYSRLRAEDDLAWLSEDFIRQSGAREHETLRLPRGRPRSLYALGLYQGLASLGQLPYLSYASEMYAYHHIEARHPFLDMRVMDFLARVPPRLKFARGWSKYLLRKAMEGVLPDAVRLRALKSAFTEVRDYGIRREKEQIAALIEQGHLVRRGWVIKQGIEALYERMLAGDKRWAGRITAFLTLEEWLSNCFGSNSGRTPTGFHHSPALRVERR